MEQILEDMILAEENDDNIENVMMQYILVDRDNVDIQQHTFDLNNLSDEFIKLNFRFERNHILRLAEALRLPQFVLTNTRNKVPGVTALCILLKRLSYPNRLCDISPLFHLSPQSLSQIITTTVNIIMQYNGHLLSDLRRLNWLTIPRLRLYSQAVQNKGGAIPNCWGFIDGTARQICRPSVNQEEYYSGHKRVHCLKYQSILCPDGIIISLKGAYPGRRHDAAIFRDSNIYTELEIKATDNDEKFVLFGDKGYGIMELVLTPFHGQHQNLPPHQMQFNESMKVLRVAVEWGFSKIIAEFAFMDYKKNQKLLLQDVESLYKVSTILTNCHTCLYGSQTSSYFDVEPPNLENYLGA